MSRPDSHIDNLNNLRGKALSYKEKIDNLDQSYLLKSITKALCSIGDREKEKLLQTRFWMTSHERKFQSPSYFFSHFV